MIQWLKDLFRPDEAQRTEFAFVEETLRARILELEAENTSLTQKLRAAARATSKSRQSNIKAAPVKKGKR